MVADNLERPSLVAEELEKLIPGICDRPHSESAFIQGAVRGANGNGLFPFPRDLFFHHNVDLVPIRILGARVNVTGFSESQPSNLKIHMDHLLNLVFTLENIIYKLFSTYIV